MEGINCTQHTVTTSKDMIGFIRRSGFPRTLSNQYVYVVEKALPVRRWDRGQLIRLQRRLESSSSPSSSSSDKGPKHRNHRLGQILLKCSFGMIVSTPLIALLQGSMLLNDYRVRYSDAPSPLMPARGVAVAIDEDDDGKKRHRPSMGRLAEASRKLRQSLLSSSSLQVDQPPLRILVVGDSLAAGVGVSKSVVPILPESIARALSKALNGRAVYWTCVGTPGVTARQLVEDINDIEPHDPHPKARQVERIVKEFQARRRRWQEWRARQQQQQQDEVEHRHVDDKDSNNQGDDVSNIDSSQDQPNVLVQWLKEMREKENVTPAEIRRATRDVATRWWTAIRNKFRKRKEQIAEDFSAIKEIVMEPLPKLDDDADDYYYDYYRENLLKEGMANESDKSIEKQDEQPRLPLIHNGSIFRRTSVNPKAAAEYDVAIVLTGLNDIKYAFMPHMNGDGMSGTDPFMGGFKKELFRILHALQGKMGKMDLDEKDKSDDGVGANSNGTGSSSSENKLKRPLVVIPELPVAPLQMFRLVPLRWFLIPVFRAMENSKRFLANTFPDYVIFVAQPDQNWWTDDEAGIGPVRENIQQEKLLLRVTDTAQVARDRIRRLMEKYYSKKEEESALDKKKSDQRIRRSSAQSAIDDENNIQIIMDDDDHDQFASSASSGARDPAHHGADLLSVDSIHPNDDGYELWGRHIAGAIIEHWNNN